MLTTDERLPTERVALAVIWLAQGERFTVRSLSERLEITPRGARQMLSKVSRVVPLQEDDGVWFINGEAEQ